MSSVSIITQKSETKETPKYSPFNLLFLRGKVKVKDEKYEVFATPYDLVNQDEIDAISSNYFIYKTRNFDCKITTTPEQAWVKLITPEWLVVSRHRLQIESDLDIEKLELSIYGRGNIGPFGSESSSDKYGSSKYIEFIFGYLCETTFFDRECIIMYPRADIVDSVMILLNYIVRADRLNIYRVGRAIIIGDISPEDMNDYCTHTFFSDIDEVIDHKNDYTMESISSFIQMVI